MIEVPPDFQWNTEPGAKAPSRLALLTAGFHCGHWLMSVRSAKTTSRVASI
jgi:hypothetical protein